MTRPDGQDPEAVDHLDPPPAELERALILDAKIKAARDELVRIDEELRRLRRLRRKA